MPDLPQNAQDAKTIAAWVEVLGPRLVEIVAKAANHDALTAAGMYPTVMEVVLPIAAASTLLARQLDAAEGHIAELEEYLQRIQTEVRKLAAKERAQEGPQVTGVGWMGDSRTYFDNMPAINAELAKGIVEMVKADQKREIDGQLSLQDAIETTDNSMEPPETGQIGPPEGSNGGNPA